MTACCCGSRCWPALCSVRDVRALSRSPCRCGPRPWPSSRLAYRFEAACVAASAVPASASWRAVRRVPAGPRPRLRVRLAPSDPARLACDGAAIGRYGCRIGHAGHRLRSAMGLDYHALRFAGQLDLGGAPRGDLHLLRAPRPRRAGGRARRLDLAVAAPGRSPAPGSARQRLGTQSGLRAAVARRPASWQRAPAVLVAWVVGIAGGVGASPGRIARPRRHWTGAQSCFPWEGATPRRCATRAGAADARGAPSGRRCRPHGGRPDHRGAVRGTGRQQNATCRRACRAAAAAPCAAASRPCCGCCACST